MEYLLFTYPNCPNCEKIKSYLSEKPIEWQEYNLARKESKLKIRDFLPDINRDESGAIILPTLIVQDNGELQTVLNSDEELDNWLKSKG